jgi:hypothetical protein
MSSKRLLLVVICPIVSLLSKNPRPSQVPAILLGLTISQDHSLTIFLASPGRELKTAARSPAAENGEVKNSARIWRLSDRVVSMADIATTVDVAVAVAAVAGAGSAEVAVAATVHNLKLPPLIIRR